MTSEMLLEIELILFLSNGITLFGRIFQSKRNEKAIVSQEMKKCLSILGCTGRFIKYSLNKNSYECHYDIKTF